MKGLRYALAFVCLSPMALWGCASSTPSDSDDGPVGEDVAAFGEVACGTDTTAHDYTTVSGNMSLFCPGGSEGVRTSADNAYGDASCTNAYIVQYTGTVWSGLGASAAWAGPALDASNCSQAEIDLDVYNSAGTATAAVTVAGSWSGSYCFFSPSGGWPAMPSGTNTRLVARAGFTSCYQGKACGSFTSYVPVTVQLNSPLC